MMKQKILRSFQVILIALALMLMMVGQPAFAQTNPEVTYGEEYYIPNLWRGDGGYLDTRNRGCEDNVLCVSADDRCSRWYLNWWRYLLRTGDCPGGAGFSSRQGLAGQQYAIQPVDLGHVAGLVDLVRGASLASDGWRFDYRAGRPVAVETSQYGFRRDLNHGAQAVAAANERL